MAFIKKLYREGGNDLPGIRMKSYLLYFFLFAFSFSKAQELDDMPVPDVNEPIGLTVDAFNERVKSSSTLLLINFTADWCMVCKKQRPILEEVRRIKRDNLQVVIIDMESNPAIAAYFEVDALPANLLYKNGHLVWDRLGLKTTKEILDLVKIYE